METWPMNLDISTLHNLLVELRLSAHGGTAVVSAVPVCHILGYSRPLTDKELFHVQFRSLSLLSLLPRGLCQEGID